MHKVRRPFDYAADHINSVSLKPGDLVEFGKDVAAGLEEAGLITSDLNYPVSGEPKKETKVIETLETGSPVVLDEAKVNEDLVDWFKKGLAAGENSEAFDAGLAENEEFIKGWNAGVLLQRGRIDLTDYDQLPWPELRALAAKLTDEAVKSKDDALNAIDAEVKRRAALISSEEGKQGE